MTTGTTHASVPDHERRKRAAARSVGPLETASGCPRNFLDNRFVYAVISPRARGLSLGVNVNPNKLCNFDCAYCEVNRNGAPREAELDLDVMARELEQTLELVLSGRLAERPFYRSLPLELLQLRHVTLSGDGEPTLCPRFDEVVHRVIHLRALRKVPFFKLVLVTNATGLDSPAVRAGLCFFTQDDEIWAKLDAGTQAYMNKVNRSTVPLEKVLANILLIGRKRPVIIQSLFPRINQEEPDEAEIEEYARRLADLKAQGAQIASVQIYSATRPTHHMEYGHLPLKSLSHIAQVARQMTGLKVEVF